MLLKKLHSRTTKFIGFFLILSFFVSVFGLSSLGRSMTKDFWTDEVFEIERPLSHSTWRIFRHGADGTPSNNPFYYVVQKHVVGLLVKNEVKTGQGLDWQFAFRLVPTISVIIGALGLGLILYKYLGFMALIFPVVILNNRTIDLYAAETRLYATVLAFSMLYYGFSILLSLEHENKSYRFWWFAFAQALTMTINNAPAIVFSVAIVMLAIHFFADNSKNKSYIRFILVTLLLNLLIFHFYNRQIGWERGNWISFTEFYNKNNHRQIYLDILFHLSFDKFFLMATLIGSAYLTVFGIIGDLRFKSRLYLIVGLIGFTQCAAVVGVGMLQLLHDYTFFSRHVIFFATVPALVLSTTFYCFWDSLGFFLNRITAIKNRGNLISTGIVLLLVFIYFPSLTLDKVKAISANVNLIKEAKKPFCVNGVWLKLKKDPTDFNLINAALHSENCSEPADKTGLTYVLTPYEWLKDY